MLSYHSDSAIKARYLARVEGHAAADEIIKRADVAMYQAKKESGGNAIRFVDA